MFKLKINIRLSLNLPDTYFQCNTLSLFQDTISGALFLYLTAFVVVLPLRLRIFHIGATLLVLVTRFVTISDSQGCCYNQCFIDPYHDFIFFRSL